MPKSLKEYLKEEILTHPEHFYKFEGCSAWGEGQICCLEKDEILAVIEKYYLRDEDA